MIKLVRINDNTWINEDEILSLTTTYDIDCPADEVIFNIISVTIKLKNNEEYILEYNKACMFLTNHIVDYWKSFENATEGKKE